MTETFTEELCNAVTKAQCLWEWDNVNDPPCHPSDENWKGCPSCYANRPILAVAFLKAASSLMPPLSQTPWVTDENGYFNETFENLHALGKWESAMQLAKTAFELDPEQYELSLKEITALLHASDEGELGEHQKERLNQLTCFVEFHEDEHYPIDPPNPESNV